MTTCAQTQYPQINYTFDKLNRLTNITYSGGILTTPAVTYTYNNGASGGNSGNNQGWLLSISNFSSATSYTAYDPLGNLLTGGQFGQWLSQRADLPTDLSTKGVCNFDD